MLLMLVFFFFYFIANVQNRIEIQKTKIHYNHEL